MRRIIPARAGFTVLPSTVWMVDPDHPRSRGVYSYFVSKKGPYEGSSPLARGLREDELKGNEIRGIIPARAGFT